MRRLSTMNRTKPSPQCGAPLSPPTGHVSGILALGAYRNNYPKSARCTGKSGVSAQIPGCYAAKDFCCLSFQKVVRQFAFVVSQFTFVASQALLMDINLILSFLIWKS